MDYKFAGPKGAGPGSDLIRHKKTLNPRITEICKRFQNLRKLYNGRDPSNPSSPRIQVSQPLPPAVPEEVQNIKGETDVILNEVLKIYQEQQANSQRQQAVAVQKKQVAQPEIPPQPSERAVERSAARMAQLEALGSNVITRMPTYLIPGFLIGDIHRHDRRKMLWGAAKAKRLSKDIENDLVTQNPRTIPSALSNTIRMYSTLKTDVIRPIIKALEVTKVPEETTKVPAEVAIAPIAPTALSTTPQINIENPVTAEDFIAALDKYSSDLKGLKIDLDQLDKETINNLNLRNRYNNILRHIVNIKNVIDDSFEKWQKRIIDEYAAVKNEYQSLYNDILTAKQQPAVSASSKEDELIKTAHNYLTREINRKKLLLNIFRDKSTNDRSARIEGDKRIRNMRDKLDKLMDLMEDYGRSIAEASGALNELLIALDSYLEIALDLFTLQLVEGLEDKGTGYPRGTTPAQKIQTPDKRMQTALNNAKTQTREYIQIVSRYSGAA